jgi:cell division transport system permease protein
MQLRHVSTNLRQGLRRNMSMHAAVVLTLFVSLTLAGVGVMLNKQTQLTTEVIGSELTLNIYLCVPDDPEAPQCTSEVTPEQEQAILDTVRANPEVRDVEVQSKEEGLQNVVDIGLVTEAQTQGDDAIITAADIPKKLRITLVEASQYDGVVSAVAGLDGVRSIEPAEDLVGGVFDVITVVQYAAWALAAILLLAALMLVANTIRLTALARRKEIEIMRLVGASRLFIVLPFLLEAIVNAVVGVALSAGALAGLMQFGIIDQLDDRFRALPFIAWPDYLETVVLIAVAGPVLTIVPTLLLTRKYLRF